MSANLHKLYIARAQKIHAQMLLIYDETVESIDKLKSDNSEDQLFLLREANAYADDLNKVAFGLARITFNIDKAKHAHRSLQHIINIVCDLVGSIYRSFRYGHEKIQTELKNNIKSATHVAERLLAIIGSDDILEYKLEILNSQSDVLFAVDRVRATNLIKFLDQQQLADVLNNEMDKIKAVLLTFDSNEINIDQKIMQCISHGLGRFQSTIDFLNIAITNEHFNDEIKNLFLDMIKSMNSFVVNMNQIRLKKNIQLDQLVQDIHRNIGIGVGAIIKLTPLLDAKENAEVSDSGTELTVYAYSNAVASMIQIRNSLEYAKSDN